MSNGAYEKSSTTTNASEPTNNEQPDRSTIPAEPQEWHPKEKDHRRNERTYWVANTILTLAAVLIAIASAIFAWRASDASQHAVNEARRQADAAEAQIPITRESFTAVQRAFIVIPDIKMTTLTQEKDRIDGWRFEPVIRNIGNTKTSNFEIFSSTARDFPRILGGYNWNTAELREQCLAKRINVPPDPEMFFSAASRRKKGWEWLEFSRDIILPQGELRWSLLDRYQNVVSKREFPLIIDKKMLIHYFFGEARYHDVFPGTPLHVTKYCFSLNGVTGGNDRPTPIPLVCRHWNCADDECKADRESFEAEIAEAANRPSNELCP